MSSIVTCLTAVLLRNVRPDEHVSAVTVSGVFCYMCLDSKIEVPFGDRICIHCKYYYLAETNRLYFYPYYANSSFLISFSLLINDF